MSYYNTLLDRCEEAEAIDMIHYTLKIAHGTKKSLFSTSFVFASCGQQGQF